MRKLFKDTFDISSLQTGVRRPVAVILGVGLVGGLAWVAVWFLHIPGAIPETRIISSAECAYTPRPPVSLQAWSPCALPDNWDISRPDYAGNAWYRFHVVQAGDMHGLGLLFASVSMNAAVYVNEVFIGSGGSMQEPVARNWNRLLYFYAPSSLLNRVENEVLVHVRGYANNSSGLGIVYAGPDEVLRPVQQRVGQLSSLTSKGAFMLAVVLGSLFLILWLYCREISYLLFSLGSLISSVYIADTFLIYIPFGQGLWEWASHSSIVVSQMFYLLFVLRVLNIKVRWVERLAVIYAVTGALILAAASSAAMLPLAAAWEGLSLIWVVLMIWISFQRWLRKGQLFSLLLGMSLTGSLFAFLHDWLPWVTSHGVAPPFLFFLGPMGFSVVASLVLVTQIMTARRREQEFTEDLQRSLAFQAQELQQEHARRVQLERAKAVSEEQQRIVRELHDGVGGHIVSAMALVDEPRSEVWRNLAAAMDELRFLMDSLDSNIELEVMLGMMRQRLEGQFRRQGVTLAWDVTEIPEGLSDVPETAIHLVRIIQEAITNSLKHARPSSISIRVERACLVITDNGAGFDPEHVPKGRGLKNIYWRAEQIGATCHMASDPDGTVIRLCWQNVANEKRSQPEPSGQVL